MGLKTHRMPGDDFSYWEALSKYLGDGQARREAKDAVVEKFEEQVVAVVQGHMEEVKLWQVHWKLGDHLRAKLLSDQQRPEEGVLYCWVDWKEWRGRHS